MEKVLELEKVSFSYAGSDAIKDVSFSVCKGDFIGLVGPNGSGKTTLLKLILGLLNQQKGKILLFGKDLKNYHEWDKIGYVPQKAVNIENNFPASVREIVAMGLLAVKKFPRFFLKEDELKVINALSLVGMQKYGENAITELSGGQQQRALIAKALVNNPELLILDEPTTGVDQENQKAFYDLLGSLNKNGITILLVSHDIGRITSCVNKIASINQKLEFYGTHKEFCSKALGHKKEHGLCLYRG